MLLRINPQIDLDLQASRERETTERLFNFLLETPYSVPNDAGAVYETPDGGVMYASSA